MIKKIGHYRPEKQHPQNDSGHPAISSNVWLWALSIQVARQIQKLKRNIIWFEDEASPLSSAPYIIKLLGMLFTCCMFPAMFTPSPGVCGDGVGGKLVGPAQQYYLLRMKQNLRGFQKTLILKQQLVNWEWEEHRSEVSSSLEKRTSNHRGWGTGSPCFPDC